MRVMLYTDGACSGNPGPGGYAAILLYEDEKGRTYRKELSAGYRLTTNNRMELLGVIVGLEALKRPCTVDLYSDSKYVISAFTEGWVEKWKANGWYRDKARREKAKNVDLWQRLLAAREMHDLQFHWVKGHEDTAENNRADDLAVAASHDEEHFLEDQGV